MSDSLSSIRRMAAAAQARADERRAYERDAAARRLLTPGQRLATWALAAMIAATGLLFLLFLLALLG